jgi:cytochrome c peroxidase
MNIPHRISLFITFATLSLSSSFALIACGPPHEQDTGIVIDTSTAPTFTAEETKTIQTLSPLPTPPPSPSNKYADDPKAAQFGQHLFYEQALSGNGTVSCSTCHNPTQGWGDQRPLSLGIGNVPRHSMTLWNAAYNRWFFWDGRADSLWAQATKPIEAANEMGSSRLQVAHTISHTPKLKAAYIAVFGSFPDISDIKRFPYKGAPNPGSPDSEGHKAWMGMTKDDQETINGILANVAKAIAAFERKIISRDAPFDTFVEGLKNKDASKQNAISNEAKWGLKLFLQKDSCIGCHNGPNFADGEFHNIGLPRHPSREGESDIGRFDGIPVVLKDPFNGLGLFGDNPKHPSLDKLRFLNDNPRETASTVGQMKTPTLRSITTSGPYMHDGRFKTLDEVITFYSTFEAKNPGWCIANHPTHDQPEACELVKASAGHREDAMLLLKLSPTQKSALKAFLHTLTGKPLPETLHKAPDTLPSK